MLRSKTMSVLMAMIMITSVTGGLCSLALAGEDTHHEEFDTVTFRSANSDVAGWGEDEVRIPREPPREISNYNTAGFGYDIDIEGDRAYLADGSNGLVIINITDIRNPAYFGGYSTGSTIYTVEAEGDLALLGEWGDMIAVNISDPENPFYLDQIFTTSTVYDMEILGHWAFVAGGSQGVLSVNISDPSSMTIADTYNTPDYAYDLDIEGDMAYVADDSSVQVLNVSDPRSVTQMTSVSLTGNAYSLEVHGDILFVGSVEWAWPDILHVYSYDISDPGSPVLLDSIKRETTAWSVRDIEVDGEYAYLADRNEGMEVIDIADPANISFLGSILDTTSSVRGLEKRGTEIFMAEGSRGLTICNISMPVTPSLLGSYDSPGSARNIFVHGDLAYVADSDRGLRVVNISDPSSPTSHGSYDTSGTSYGVWLEGDRAYMADDTNGLVILNVTDPSSPQPFGSYDSPGNARDVRVVHNISYLADLGSGLQVVHVGDPGNPVQVGNLNTAGSANALWVEKNFTFVADGVNGLVAVDVNDPLNPTQVDTYDTGGTALDVQVEGDLAYVADGSGGLVIINVSDPTAMTHVATYDTDGTARGLHVFGDQIHVADDDEGLQIVNVSDPWNPALMSNYTSMNDAWSVVVTGNVSYVSNRGAGLYSILSNQDVSDRYQDTGRAETSALDSTTDLIVAVNLTVNSTVPAGTHIHYNVSNDGGATWQTVTPGNLFHFTSYSSDLRWRADLVTDDPTMTPVLQNVTAKYYYDDLDPVSDAVNGAPDYDNSGTIPVTWTAQDPFPDTGLRSVELHYRYDANSDGDFGDPGDIGWSKAPLSPQTGTSGTFYFNPGGDNGVYEFFTVAIDNASHMEADPATADDTTVYDDRAPHSNCTEGSPAYVTGGSFSISYNASDVLPGSGLRNVSLYHRYDGNGDGDFNDAGDSEWTDSGLTPKTASSGSFSYNPGTSEGVYEFFTVATDNATNREEDFPVVRDTSTVFDATAPTTDYTVSGTRTASGWYIGSVDVFLSASDGISGVKDTSYRLNGGSWNQYTTAIKLTSDGTHTLDYYSEDEAGNVEVTGTVTVRIDNEAPSTDPTITGTMGENGWYTSQVTIDLDATDGHSGVNETWYRSDGGTWTEYTSSLVLTQDGEHNIDYYTVDNATNEERQGDITVKIDKETPDTVHHLSGPGSVNRWYSAPVTLFLEAEDNTSGVNHTFYSLDGGPWLTYSGPLMVEDEGSTVVEYYSADVAGNREIDGNVTIRIDTVTPVTDYTVDGEEGVMGWYISNVTVDLISEDVTSGPNRTLYRLDGGTWTVYTEAVLIHQDGIHQMEFYSVDEAMNEEEVISLEIKVDRTAPTVGHSITTGKVGDVYPTAVTLTIFTTDATSGPGAVEYMMDDGNWTPYSGPFLVEGDGKHQVVYRALDQAGNVGSGSTGELIIDTTPPSVDISLKGNLSGGWYSGPVEVTVEADDGQGNISETLVSVDGGPWKTHAVQKPIMVTGAGEHQIKAMAVDRAGHESREASSGFRIDDRAPTTTEKVEGTLSNSGWYVSWVRISLDAEDDLSGVAATTYRVDGGVWEDYDGTFTLSENGKHLVIFRSTDVAGNEEVVGNLSIPIDLEPPLLTFTSHEDGQVVTDPSVTLMGETETGAEVMIDGEEAEVEGGSMSIDLDLEEGKNEIEGVAIDRAGHETRTSITLVLDSSPPVVSIYTPTAGEVVTQKEVLITGNTEPGANLSIDGRSVPVDATGSFTMKATIPKGEHVFVIKASDPHGNEAETSIAIKRKAPEPDEITVTEALPSFFLAIIIAAVIAAVLAFFLGRRMGGGGDPITTGPEGDIGDGGRPGDRDAYDDLSGPLSHGAAPEMKPGDEGGTGNPGPKRRVRRRRAAGTSSEGVLEHDDGAELGSMTSTEGSAGEHWEDPFLREGDLRSMESEGELRTDESEH